MIIMIFGPAFLFKGALCGFFNQKRKIFIDWFKQTK